VSFRFASSPLLDTPLSLSLSLFMCVFSTSVGLHSSINKNQREEEKKALMGEIKEECTSLDKSEQEKQLHSKVSKVALYSSGESKAIASACETASSLGSVGPEVSHLEWGRWYKL